MTFSHLFVFVLLFGLGLGFSPDAAAQSGCTNAVVPPSCIAVDDSGDVYPDHNVTNSCPHPTTLWFDVQEPGDDWILDRNNFTARYRYMAVDTGGTGRSGIRYSTTLTIHCCPDIEGSFCSGQPVETVPN